MDRFTPTHHEEHQEHKCDEEPEINNSTAHWMGRCALVSWIQIRNGPTSMPDLQQQSINENQTTSNSHVSLEGVEDLDGIVELLERIGDPDRIVEIAEEVVGSNLREARYILKDMIAYEDKIEAFLQKRRKNGEMIF